MSRLNVLFCVFLYLDYSRAQTCPKNEVLDNCPATCDWDFCPKSNVEPKSCEKNKKCPPAECKCGFNYRRADNGTCIPTISCPPFSCKKPNEEYNPCPPYCPSDSCNQASETGECPLPGFLMTAYCNPACRCVQGYWRKNDICVPYEECKNEQL
ncbi:trypsin inhibitor like cysteine rich domain-containing protein [Phthorimaea operculella]|nr:trypsin inhibitor like cysteine rich domain-containing protein [Phthorimaea operculella]